MAQRTAAAEKHELDLERIDEVQEISGDHQLAHVFCETCRDWEWHWIAYPIGHS